MAKKGIKVKDLAKELSVTSRSIIARCRAEGIPVQNSVTRLSPEIERSVREWFSEDRAVECVCPMPRATGERHHVSGREELAQPSLRDGRAAGRTHPSSS